ncbi:MAG: hypothetical protein ABIQ44_01895 [Chloroflexia bacterium]
MTSAIRDPQSEIAPVGLHTMSREGRRQAIVLLLGVISIAIFALWSFINILQDGVDGVEWVSAILMLAILLVTPLVAWTLLEEAQASVQANDHAITYKTAGGISITYPWTAVTGFEQKTGRGRLARFFLGDDNDPAPTEPPPGEPSENVADEEPGTLLLLVKTDPSQQIANPLIRFLHRQAYSVNLPIHGGLEARQQLIEEIKTRTGS